MIRDGNGLPNISNDVITTLPADALYTGMFLQNTDNYSNWIKLYVDLSLSLAFVIYWSIWVSPHNKY